MFRFASAVVAVHASVSPKAQWQDDGLSLLQMKKTTIVAADRSDVALLRSTVRFGEEYGNEVKQRALTEEDHGPNGFETVDFDAGPFTTYGVITGARIFVSSPGNKNLRFRIYRPMPPPSQGVMTIGYTASIDTPQPGVQEVTFSSLPGRCGPTDGVAFIPGDFLGWSTTGSGVFPYDITGQAESGFGLPPGSNPTEGVRFYIAGVQDSLCSSVSMKRGWEQRTYSYMMITRPAVESDICEQNACRQGQGWEDFKEKLQSEGAFDPPEDDAAAAVGDPHITTRSGRSFDMDEGMVHH